MGGTAIYRRKTYLNKIAPIEFDQISGSAAGSSWVDINYDLATEPAFYRNLEKDNDLPLADYTGRVKSIQTAMEFMESGSDATYYNTVVRNVPYIQDLVDNPTNFGMHNATVATNPDGVLKKISYVTYLGDYNGSTNCVRFYYLLAEGQITGSVGDKMILFNVFPKGQWRNTSIIVPENTGDWNSTYTCGSSGIWERSPGNYSLIADGYDSANAPRFRQHEFRATSLSGPWTDQQGATENLWDSSHVPSGYIGIWIIVGINSLPDDPTYDYAGATVLVNTSNATTVPSIAVWSSDMSSRYAFAIQHNYSFSIGYTVYNSLKYWKGKWYYSFQDGTYQTGKRVVLVSDSIYGMFTYHSTIMDFATLDLNANDGRLYTGSFANGSLNVIAGKLYFWSSGQTYPPYDNYLAGDWRNHAVFLWVYNEITNTWSLKTTPMLTSPHSSVVGDWGFNWGQDHMGYACESSFVTTGNELWYTTTMCDGTDTYQLTNGYLDLDELMTGGLIDMA